MSKSIRVQSPGRINIIGEHTDYNEGFVLPAAIDKNITVDMQLNDSASTCNIKANNLNEIYTFDLNQVKPTKPGWENYVLGVVDELQQLGAKFAGFDATFAGDVPIGSGMSSSAALECSFAFALNELFDLGFDKWQLIKAAQMAEHHFVGTKCGIMDQFASVMGKKDQVMLLDCRSLEYQYFPCNLGDYQLILLNTNVSHSLASSEYNTRREECETGVKLMQNQFPDIQSLRDVSREMFEAEVASLPSKVAQRCKHIISENARVKEATEALIGGNFEKLGQLMYASHYSLQHDYEVSCPELDYLVAQTEDKDYVLGSRMMGGGFGGCTINLVRKDRLDTFQDKMAAAYRKKFELDLTPYLVSIENGTTIL